METSGTTPLQASVDLHACPFCGEAAHLWDSAAGWKVSCDNSACPVAPDTFGHKTKRAAVEAWNTRRAGGGS